MEQEIQKNLKSSEQITTIFISVLITALVVGGISYFVFGKLNLNKNNSLVNPPIQQTTNDQLAKNQEQKSDIVGDFIESSYRVIAVLQNSFAPYSLIIATERSEAQCGSKEEPSRCEDDGNCGSIYTSPNCYFFVEPNFVAHTDASTRFVGKWKGGLDVLNIDSIKFKDANNIQFSSAGGDAGIGVQAVWNLDLKTGQIMQISREEIGPE